MDTKNSSVATVNLNFSKNETKNASDQIESHKEVADDNPLLDKRDYDDSYAMMLKLNQVQFLKNFVFE